MLIDYMGTRLVSLSPQQEQLINRNTIYHDYCLDYTVETLLYGQDCLITKMTQTHMELHKLLYFLDNIV